MSTGFDPYRKWLGIPPRDQPPNHYRLLGIELFESDPDVISNAADARMAHVRSFQTGPYSEWSQKILNEIAAAKVCLLNPEKKASYDAHLRTQLAAQGLWAPPAAPMTGGVSGMAEGAWASASSGQPVPSGGSEPREGSFAQGGDLGGTEPICSVSGPTSGVAVSQVLRRRRKSWQGPALLALGAVGVMVLAALFIWMVNQGPSELAQATAQQDTQKGFSQSSDTLSGNGKGGPGASSKGPTAGSLGKREKVSSKGVPSGPTPPEASPSSLPSSPGESSKKEKAETSPHPSESSTKEPTGASKTGSSVPSAPASSEKQPLEKQSPGAEEKAPTPEKPSMSEEPSEEPKPEKPAPKRPAPSASEQAKAEQEIRSLLKEDFASAEKSGGQKALAEKLLQHARETEDQPAAQYRLFRLAAEWAVRAADSSLLHEAVDGLARQFEVDVREVLADAIEKGASAPAEETLLPVRVELIQSVAEEALAEEDYSGADRLAKAALALARRSKNSDLPRDVASWAGRIERLSQQYAKLRDQMAQLAQNPEDPEANLAVARWYAFQLGQWEKALPYMAKGSQPEWAEIARRDLEGPHEPAAQQKLGDSWWELSEKASGEERQALQGRAVYWYEQALPHLSGLSQTSVRRRIETYQNSLAQKEPARWKKGESVLFFDGQKTYATVPNFLYDGTKPLTVEVILKAHSDKQDGAIVGNLAPAGGWLLALAKDPDRSSSSRYWVFFFQSRLMLRRTASEDAAQIGQRVMLAAVYDGQDIRIFVNGRRQYTAASVARHRPGPPQLLIGASAAPTGGGVTNFFHGTIEQIRISSIVRYTTHFTPPERLEKDKATDLLLHFDAGQGTAVRDLSGARRAARILAGKWVPRDAPNP